MPSSSLASARVPTFTRSLEPPRNRADGPFDNRTGHDITLLLSGGMDSTVLLYELLAAGWRTVHALTVVLGTRGGPAEARAAKAVVSAARRRFGRESVTHKTVRLGAIGSLMACALTDAAAELPTEQGGILFPHEERIRVEYIPNRNPILLALAYAHAFSTQSSAVALAVYGIDFPDIGPDFLAAFARMERLALRTLETQDSYGAVGLVAPYAGNTMARAQVLARGLAIGTPVHLSWSCYTSPPPEMRRGRWPWPQCGLCSSCEGRGSAYAALEAPDPTAYLVPPYIDPACAMP